MEVANKYKIAIVTAHIGDSGGTGSLSISDEARMEMLEYGVDLYSFTTDQLSELQQYYNPRFDYEDIIHSNMFDKIIKWYYRKIKYKQLVYPSTKNTNNRLIAKLPKMCFYYFVPDNYDYIIWLDSKFTIEKYWLKYILWLINKNSSADLIISKHSARHSVKEEVDYILKSNNIDLCSKYNKSELAYQIYKYNQSLYFKDIELYECGLIIYNRNIICKKEFLEEWYAHNFFYSIQDQLSFPYLVQKHRIKIATIIQDVMKMPFSSHEYNQ